MIFTKNNSITRHARIILNNRPEPVLVRVHVSSPLELAGVSRVEAGSSPNVVNAGLVRCPRCQQTLVDEGFAYYCRYGCTRSWPKLGALLSERYARERFVGVKSDPLDLHGSKYHDGITSLWKSTRDREKQKSYKQRWAEKKRRARVA